MDYFLNLLIVILTVVSTMNCGVLNRESLLQSYINNLLTELQSTPMDVILYWNLVTLQACANDYNPSIVVYPDQFGPTATSRAFAIIHGAMYESMTVVNRVFEPNSKSNVHKKSAVNGAIMEAAYQTLSAMYPQQQSIFKAVRKKYLSHLKTGAKENAEINEGILVGQVTATVILDQRKDDNSQVNASYTPTNLPGYHQVDPTHPDQGFLGVYWGHVKPFLLNSGSQFRPASVVGSNPASRLKYLNSTRYVNDFNEVKSIGSKTSTVRTNDQTDIGIAWAYDLALKIGVPPRLYNQIVRVIVIKQNNTLKQNAHLFALVNYAMGDAGIAAWDCKYYYNFWRPIVGICEATGYTVADPNWLPSGSPSDNTGTNFTPGFPSYVSGHSTFGSAVFESLRQFYKTDNISFHFQSDEFNGKTYDSNTGQIRPAKTRYYRSFTAAENENFLSRICLGVHWRTDQQEGKTLGRNVAKFAFENFH